MLAQPAHAGQRHQQRRAAAHQRVGQAHVRAAVDARHQREVHHVHDHRRGDEGPACGRRLRQRRQRQRCHQASRHRHHHGGQQLVAAALDHGIPRGMQESGKQDDGEDGKRHGRQRSRQAAQDRAILAAPACPAAARLSCAADPPDRIADVVGHQQAAALVDRHAHRPPARLAVVVDKPGQHVERRALRPALAERHEDHLVAGQRAPVPRTMQADEHAVAEARRQAVAAGSGQAERGGMRAHGIVRHDGPGHQVWCRRLHALVHMLAVVAVGPAIEAAVAHRGDVVRHQVAADLVALVDGGPQHARDRLPRHAIGVAQPAGKDAVLAGAALNLPDRGAAGFLVHAVFAHVAVRAHGHVKLAAIAAGDQALGPVMVERPAGQVDHLLRRGADFGLAVLVREAQQRVGGGHIEVIADQRHAERRIHVLQEHRALVGNAVAVAVAQQRDAVGAGRAGAGALHHHLHDPALDALAVVGLGRRIALGHQHVAVGQHIDPARMVQLVGKRRHRHAFRRHRALARGPADGRRDLDGGNRGLVGGRQLWGGPETSFGRQLGGFAAGDERGHHGHGARQHGGAQQAQGRAQGGGHRHGPDSSGRAGQRACAWTIGRRATGAL
ncbi:protein of unknown function (plasmid) [Cupriavidus taiwanensis]|uniref:Uncharacterized protein n=1 Tax=Cupriavidus taiwanensis TaxID=164546 RepID=A0A7Z7JER5_9BURK|nr:protein of unknown function [Cupriavidus taiwanensis]SOZ11818.1 protein of unknown function [Cupriavidus taiwanensis]SOZ43173.1 protein of unknown function [Cupriavidus taiwanensis]SPC22419.1 protein of unknown function [Cupriavidus taiwanensis]SPD53926.1 protein of unknown function [Cupriavidus taiwanensis]